MAVVGSAKEQWESRKGKYSGGIWTYTRSWLIQTDSKNDREGTVAGASGLPSYGDAHPSPVNDAAYAIDIEYSALSETPLAWIATATYSSERNVHATDPTQDEVLTDWDTEIYQQPVLVDVNGDAVINSAGDYFIDPLPQQDSSRLMCKVQANVTTVPAWVLTSGNNAVNNAQIEIDGLTIAKGLAKTSRLKVAQRKYRFGQKYYPISFEVHIRLEGWRLQPLDAGFRFRNSEGKLSDITNDGDDNAPTTPVPLDGSGGILVDPTPSTAVFGDFTIYHERDLSALPGIT